MALGTVIFINKVPVYTAHQHLEAFGEDDPKKVAFHLIQPKYCRLLGLDPDKMLVVSESRIWVDTLVARIDRAYAELHSIKDLRERVWLAHVAAFRTTTSPAVMDYIKTKILGLPATVTPVRLECTRIYPKPRKIDPAEGDARLEELIGMQSSREALSWFKKSRAPEQLLGLTGSSLASKRLVLRLYKLGAKSVYVIGIKKQRRFEQSGTLVIELPTEKAKRRALMREESKIAIAGGFDPMGDIGQRFFLLKLD